MELEPFVHRFAVACRLHHPLCFPERYCRGLSPCTGTVAHVARPAFRFEVAEALPVWKKSVSIMLKEGLAVPVFSAALNYFLGLTTHHSQANMIQAMRDYFGAHTFERVDSPRGEFFHEQWQEKK